MNHTIRGRQGVFLIEIRYTQGVKDSMDRSSTVLLAEMITYTIWTGLLLLKA